MNTTPQYVERVPIIWLLIADCVKVNPYDHKLQLGLSVWQLQEEGSLYSGTCHLFGYGRNFN